MKQLLLIEDDELIAKELIVNLEKSGYLVTHLKTLLQASVVDVSKFSAAILDWNLPDGESVHLVQRIREQKINVPILMLSANTDLEFRNKAKECGVDDYLGKPFYFHELKTRIDLLLAKPNEAVSTSGKNLNISGIQLSPVEMIVKYNNETLTLTKKEFDLLHFFMKNPNTVFSRNELLDAVWGEDIYSSQRTVDTHVLHLRKKIDADFFQTVWSSGYRFTPEPEKQEKVAKEKTGKEKK